jgi:hypothetical protein
MVDGFFAMGVNSIVFMCAGGGTEMTGAGSGSEGGAGFMPASILCSSLLGLAGWAVVAMSVSRS